MISTRQWFYHYHSSTNIWEKLFPPGSSSIIIIHQPTFERNYFNQAVVLSLSFINQHLGEIISTGQQFYHYHLSTNIWEKLFPPGSSSIIIIHQPTFERNYFNQAVVLSLSFINQHLREIISTRQWFHHHHSSTNIWEKLFPPGSSSIIIIYQPTFNICQPIFERNYFHQAVVLSLSFINQHLGEIISIRQWFYHYHSSTIIWEKLFQPGSGSIIIIHQPTFERNYLNQAVVPSLSFINQHLREIISTRQRFHHYHSSTNIWKKLFLPGSSSIIIIHQPTFERNDFHQAAVPPSSFINQHLREIISTRQRFHHYHSSTNIWEKLFPPGSSSTIIIHQPTFERNYFHQAAVLSSSSFINQHLREIISTRQQFYHYHSLTNIWEKLFPPGSSSIIIIHQQIFEELFPPGSGSIIIIHQPTFERNYFHQAAVPSLSFINQHLREMISIRQQFHHYHSSTNIWEIISTR